MGTKTDPRRARAQRRGLATFVSFLLLFAFALGQSSITALANDGSTDPVASEEAAPPDGSRLPAADAPAEEAPAAEAPAEEPPAEEPPAAEDPADTPAETPASDATGDDSGASSGGGAASVSSDGSGSGANNNKRLNRNVALAAPIGVQQVGLAGGDVSLDFVAAGPFTYNHTTGLGTNPPFGFNSRTISKNNGVVESLESGDFQCNDLVTFFTQIVVDDGAAGSGTIEIDYSFGNETTGQPGLGFDDIVSYGIHIPDGGNAGNVADNVVTLTDEFVETQGYNELHGTFEVTNLAPGESAILRITVHLACFVGSPTGNIQNQIDAARVTAPETDTISVGQQNVPMKVTGFVSAPSISIVKDCPESSPFGEDIVYDITITNDGNEDLDTVVVTDTVDSHSAVTVVGFPSTLAAGASATAQFTYSPTANDPDPLPNSATVTAAGAVSNTTVSDTDNCTTDITHVPGIDVEKSCPESVPLGEDIEYTITVENTGNEALSGVTVIDSLLGDITGDFDFDFSTDFPVGGFATAVVTYQQQAGDPDPITNTVEASGTGVDSAVLATDEASCETDITHVPGIDVEKSCPESVPVGEDVEYTITVTNTGNESLENVTVTDSLLGDITDQFDFDFTTDFPVGATATATVTYQQQPGDPDPITNTVTASGFGVDSGVEATDEASCETDITHVPGIDVTKTCPESVPLDEDIEYTITVTNTGNEPLVGVTVIDSLLGDITGDFDFDFTDPFPVGATATATVTYQQQAGDPDPITNTVTASGNGEDSGAEATDEASCETDITHVPGIDVTKSCPGSVLAGNLISYTITVTNTGNEPLVGVTVTDSLMGDITGDFDFDFTDPFPVGATATANVSYMPQAGDPDPLTNTVTASGNGEDSETQATDVASCITDILNPSIDVEKSCAPLAHVGDTVTYTITVTNTGDVDLTNVTVSDTILGDLSASFADDLAVGASESHDFQYTVLESDPDPLVNVVTASGVMVQSETTVSDTADCVTDLIHPAIDIVKTVDEDLVPVGTTVTYTYVVTNTGDTTLYDVSVDDDIMGHIGDIPILEPGQSVTLTKDFVVGQDPVTNVATASGEDILGHSVSATDDAVVTPILGENPPPPTTPFTGSDAGRLGLIAMALLGLGATLVAVTRRRRTEDGTA